MVGIRCTKTVPVGSKSRCINIIHGIIFHQYRIITTVIRIANHRFYIVFRTMVISFIIPFESPIHHIPIDINGTLPIISLRYMDT